MCVRSARAVFLRRESEIIQGETPQINFTK